MQAIKDFAHRSKKYLTGLFKWLLSGLIIGIVCGLVGAAFHICVEEATEMRLLNPWLIWLLPLGGLAIAGLYDVSHVALDTNIVIRAVQENSAISWLMAPLIFLASTVSHLFGASVGREGAALQIGGALGYQYGLLMRMDEADIHVVVMSGMSAVFSAVFGTPITAMFFALEVSSVGIMYYAGLLPCLMAALSASAVARALGITGFNFAPLTVPELCLASVGQAALIGIACALLSIIFCLALHTCEKQSRRLLKSSYLRIFAGGLLIALLTLLVGSHRYNGAGSDIITAAISGTALPWDFAVKLVFTAICVGVGYKGGEIVPTLFIGATFGCVIGPLIGMDPGFAAALGMSALFCGMVNCPIASVFLSLELFGAGALAYFVIVCVLSYMLSGSYGLYRQQSVVFSKVKAQLIDKVKL